MGKMITPTVSAALEEALNNNFGNIQACIRLVARKHNVTTGALNQHYYTKLRKAKTFFVVRSGDKWYINKKNIPVSRELKTKFDLKYNGMKLSNISDEQKVALFDALMMHR